MRKSRNSATPQILAVTNLTATSYQEVNCEVASLVESAAAKQQTAKLARQVNGVTAVINTLHVQAEN